MLWDLSAGLRDAQAGQAYRVRAARAADAGPLDFCSNDYLGLSRHPAVIEAAQQAMARWGLGAGASQLVTGYTEAHEQLESELAAFIGQPRCLLFSSGYLANLGVISALCGRGDTVIEDRLNHASLIDAAQLSRARLLRYRHADTVDLAERLESSRSGHRLVATDAVFSMDGDLGPLAELSAVADRQQAALLVDDAHGFGVLGPDGRGAVAAAGLQAEQVPIHVITFGKALGGAGAAVLGSADLIETVTQRARSLIYTTALPPAIAAGVGAALRCLRDEPQHRQRLHGNIALFRSACTADHIPLAASDTPIQPLIVGSNAAALALSERLLGEGLKVVAIRPPTVPEGQARLRITLSAAHTREQVERLVAALGKHCSAGES